MIISGVDDDTFRGFQSRLWYFFPIHDSVPKAQKSQGQGLANEGSYMVALRPSCFVFRVSCFVRTYVRASRYMSPTFLTYLHKVILRDILN